MANTQQKPKIVWQTKGFEPRSFDPLVVATVFLVFVAAVSYALYSREWLTAATFVAVAIAFIWYINMDKTVVTAALYNDHLAVNQEVYPFDQYTQWWHAPANNMLYLKSTDRSVRLSTVAIPLGTQDIEKIAALFPASLIQIERSAQDTPDTIANWLRYQ